MKDHINVSMHLEKEQASKIKAGAKRLDVPQRTYVLTKIILAMEAKYQPPTKPEMEKKTVVQMRMPKALYKWLERKAKEGEISIQEVLRDILK